MGLSMRGNAMDYINSYIAKKFDDKFYIGLITNYKGDLWHVEYEMEIKKILMPLKFRRVYNCIIHSKTNKFYVLY